MKSDSGTLIINIMSEGKAETYEGIYQCTARNERGAAVSNNIVIRPSSKYDLSTKQLDLCEVWLQNAASVISFKYYYKKVMTLIPIL